MRRQLIPITLLMLAAATATPARAQDAIAERGLATFMKNGCHGCHIIGKVGSPIGPDLSRVGVKFGPDYLRRWLRNPAAVRPDAHMPALELTDADIDTLAAYLSTRR
jgi:cbb3-type cytochrome oxidase cytochrome c subunit